MDGTLASRSLRYTGGAQPQPGERDNDGHQLYPYLPSKELIEAVNLAIQLERPLLVKGEPGCGKTRLGQAVAYELGLPYESWHVKSISRARDGLYTYDAIGRLRDAQLSAAGRLSENDIAQMDAPLAYVGFGPLGKAFQNDQRTVVLIDEIDKADIDFPNDLLLELDEQRFFIEESRPRLEIRAKAAPIVFVTSNDEKDLPDAFLRRCLFYYIEFPDRDHLIEILNAHFSASARNLVAAIVDRFLELRKEMEEGRASKRVSTSELIDWFRVLRHYPEDEVLKRLSVELMHPSILLKSWDDYRRYSLRVQAGT